MQTPLIVPGGSLTGARYLPIAQLALEALTATRGRQREIDRQLYDALLAARRDELTRA